MCCLCFVFITKLYTISILQNRFGKQNRFPLFWSCVNLKDILEITVTKHVPYSSKAPSVSA